jgi:hypothetical protein
MLLSIRWPMASSDAVFGVPVGLNQVSCFGCVGPEMPAGSNFSSSD